MKFMRLALVLLVLQGGLRAQNAPSTEKSRFQYSGSYRSRLEVWDWFEGQGDGSYAFSGNLLRINFGQTGKRMDWQVELAAPFLLALPKNAIAPAPQLQLGLGGNYYGANDRESYVGMVFPKQGFLRFKNLFGRSSQSLRLGRFEFAEGTEVTAKDPTLAAVKRDRVAQRLIGPFPFTHVGRSFDGLHYIANSSKGTFTLVAALPTRGAFQVDGWGNLRTGFVYGSLAGQRNAKGHSSDWRLFAIYYHDWRHVLKTDNRPLPARQGDLNNIRIGTFGGHVMHAVKTGAGTFDFFGWGALQTGRWGRQDHGAGSAVGEIGWQPEGLDRLKPWLRAGFTYGSGDGNPGDSKHNSFFQLLSTPRIFARTPFYNMMNSQDYYAGLVLRPLKDISIRPDYHAVRLSDPLDLWYQGGGAFQPWSFGYVGRNTSRGRGLANLYDVSFDWNIRKNVSLVGYYGHMQGKAGVENIYPKGPDGNFGYLEVTFRF